jgi:nitrite reductase/ring-hydroxylating ferredoxin subunit
MSWRPTGIAAATLLPGLPRELVEDGRSIVLVRTGEAVHALEGLCPHTGGLLADGELEDFNLRCPEHGACFDVRSGVVTRDPGGVVPPQGGVDALRTYPVRVVDGMIELEL